MLIDPKLMFMLGIIFFVLIAFLALVLYVTTNWKEIKATRKANCLIWHHPDNVPGCTAQLELAVIKNPPGPNWPYSSFFFLPEKMIKWCYEIKDTNKQGEVSYSIKPFYPDDHIDYKGVTTGELADALDWRPAKRLIQQKAPVLQKVAQMGAIILGCAALFGIFALLDMLGKGG